MVVGRRPPFDSDLEHLPVVSNTAQCQRIVEEESMGKKPWTMAAFAAVFVLIVAACGPAATTAPSTGPGATTPAATTAAGASAPPATAAPPAAVPKVPTGYAELDQALGASQPFKGKTVNVQTQ